MNNKFEKLEPLILEIDNYCGENKIEYIFAAIDNEPTCNKISLEFAAKTIYYNVVKNDILNKALNIARRMLKDPMVKL